MPKQPHASVVANHREITLRWFSVGAPEVDLVSTLEVLAKVAAAVPTK